VAATVQAGGVGKPVEAHASNLHGGFASGLVGGFIGSAGMLALGLLSGQPTAAEIVAEIIARITPLEIIDAVVTRMGADGKHLLFASVLVGQIGLAGAVGWAWARNGWSNRRGGTFVIGLVTLVAVIVLAVIQGGLLGNASRLSPLAVGSSLLTFGGLFSGAYLPTRRYLNPGGVFAEEDSASRRRLLRNGSIALFGTVFGVAGFRWLTDRLAPPEVAPVLSSEAASAFAAIAERGSLQEALVAGVPGLSPEITPNPRFYVVSKNVIRDPAVDSQSWQLEVTGLVDRPYRLGYAELLQLPASTQYFTLQCISNEVGGELIGNALWKGVPMADLLSRAGVKPAAADVVFSTADDYSDSIPIAKALETGTMLAYEMNGEVLPQAHGFPARLLVPDIYGMKNAKWVTKIEVVEYDYRGYWQSRGWSDRAVMNTTSRIDLPRPMSFLRPGTNYLGGVAIAGSRGVEKVEVSTDGGATWQEATIKPALGPNAWTLWLAEWTFPEGERERRLLVRATDGTGAIQTSDLRETLPEGATGYHTVPIRRAIESS
jgi:DMSO/TMAO reductase YedYZ molybdopterin-dependent catalytic subunit